MINILNTQGNQPYGVKKYALTTKAELQGLEYDCAVGSMAYVEEEKKKYILSTLKEWVPVNTNSGTGGGGGSDIDEDNILTNDEILELLNEVEGA